MSTACLRALLASFLLLCGSRVAPLSGSGTAARGGLPRASAGAAIPGLYGIALHDEWGFGLELPPEQASTGP